MLCELWFYQGRIQTDASDAYASAKIEKSWFMLLEIYRYIMSPIVKALSNKRSPINEQIFA
jgi:hypothetical protein